MHGSIALREEIGCIQPDKVPQFFLSPTGVMLLWRASEESVEGLHWHEDKRHSDVV